MRKPYVSWMLAGLLAVTGPAFGADAEKTADVETAANEAVADDAAAADDGAIETAAEDQARKDLVLGQVGRRAEGHGRVRGEPFHGDLDRGRSHQQLEPDHHGRGHQDEPHHHGEQHRDAGRPQGVG